MTFKEKQPESKPRGLQRWIEPGHRLLSIAQQCELLELPRSSYYYEPAPERRWHAAGPKSSTPIRARSSPATRSRRG